MKRVAMTTEEAIWWANHLFEIRKEEYFNKGMVEDAIEVEKAQTMVLEALSVEAEWIPCSERLPEIYTPVILSGKYNEVIGYRRNDSDWMALTGDGWETDIEHPEDFIAWMPLPEPYKGGDTE